MRGLHWLTATFLVSKWPLVTFERLGNFFNFCAQQTSWKVFCIIVCNSSRGKSFKVSVLTRQEKSFDNWQDVVRNSERYISFWYSSHPAIECSHSGTEQRTKPANDITNSQAKVSLNAWPPPLSDCLISRKYHPPPSPLPVWVFERCDVTAV